MKFLHRISIKKFLTGVMGAMVLAVMSGNNVWKAYKNTQEISRVDVANEMADDILTAAGFEAKERGMTAMVLSSNKASDSSFIDKIHETRARGEEALKKANGLSKKLVQMDSTNTALQSALRRAETAYSLLESARREADRNLGVDEKNYSSKDWIKTITNFIEANSEVRLAAFTSNASKETLQEALRMNLELKQSVWLVGEFAGRERATLAQFVSAKKPLDAAAAEKLNTFRAIVDINIKPILRFKDMNGVDPAVVKSISKVKEVFLSRFGETRAEVYAAASTGNYPINGKEWIDRSSEAIDTVVELSNTIGAVVDDGVMADLAATLKSTIEVFKIAGTVGAPEKPRKAKTGKVVSLEREKHAVAV